MTYKATESILICTRKKVFRKSCLIAEIREMKKLIENERENNTTYNYSEKSPTNIKISSTEKKCIKIMDTYQSQLESLHNEYEILNTEVGETRSKLDLAFEKSEMAIAEYEVLIHYYFEGINIGKISELCNYSYGYIGQLKRQAIKKFDEYNNSKNL